MKVLQLIMLLILSFPAFSQGFGEQRNRIPQDTIVIVLDTALNPTKEYIRKDSTGQPIAFYWDVSNPDIYEEGPFVTFLHRPEDPEKYPFHKKVLSTKAQLYQYRDFVRVEYWTPPWWHFIGGYLRDNRVVFLIFKHDWDARSIGEVFYVHQVSVLFVENE